MYPKITVVTPSFNQGEFIERKIIKKYQDKIDWWCSEKDNGQTAAINKGMKRATGDLCCWINSDDVLLPGSLFQVAEFYAKHPDCEFMNGVFMECDKQDRILGIRHILMNKFLMKHGCGNVCQQGMFWKRSLFDRLGYLNESFHAMMDFEWLIRVYESGAKVMLFDKPLGAIRVYAETKTAQHGLIWEVDNEAIRKMYNGDYVRNRHSFYFILFVCYKIVKGCYLKNIIETLIYRGKKITSYSY